VVLVICIVAGVAVIMTHRRRLDAERATRERPLEDTAQMDGAPPAGDVQTAQPPPGDTSDVTMEPVEHEDPSGSMDMDQHPGDIGDDPSPDEMFQPGEDPEMLSDGDMPPNGEDTGDPFEPEADPPEVSPEPAPEPISPDDVDWGDDTGPIDSDPAPKRTGRDPS
jgi:hypothetical protein